MSLFGPKIESYIGVDIGAHGIKLVEFRKTKGRPQLWTYGIVDQNLDIHVLAVKDKPVEELLIEHQLTSSQKQTESPFALIIDDRRIAEYAELLKLLAKKARVQGRRVISSLPVSQVFHTIINLPKVEEKEIDHLVRAEIRKLLSRPLESTQIVYQKVPLSEEQDKKFIRILVTTAPKELVAFYSSIFQRAGLQLQELETEAFALSRSLVGHDQSVSMLVDVGAERTNFFIVDNGLPVTHRSLQIGGNDIDKVLAEILDMSIAEVNQAKIDLSGLPVEAISFEPFMRLLDPIVKEIQYNFDLYLHQSGNETKRPEKIVLTGGSGLFPPIIRYIQTTFPLRVFVGDPWARVIYQSGLKSILSEIGPRMAVAIGLALRNF